MALQFATVPLSRIEVPTPSASLLVEAFARTIRARDPNTHAHAERVRAYSLTLARTLGMKDSRVLDAIAGAALVHDVGKLGISDAVLNKPGPLTPEEYAQVKQHVVIGADLLSAAALPRALSTIVRHHHERWDGSGYPDGLRGEDIPIGARIVAVADCFDALTSWRPYRDAVTHEDAALWISARRNTAFDPIVADAFLGVLHVMRDVTRSARPVHVRLV